MSGRNPPDFDLYPISPVVEEITDGPGNNYGKRLKQDASQDTNSETAKLPDTSERQDEKIFLKKLLILLEDIDVKLLPAAKDMRKENPEQMLTKNPNIVPKLPDNRVYFKKRDVILIKNMGRHELSMEKQRYYIDITEACVGQNNKMRNEALQTLTLDPELYIILPHLCKFIMDGVKLNVVENSLTILIYLMRMLKAILDNQYVFLDKYLHQLIPSIITCIVSRELGARREYDYHWYLRDFASRLIAQICITYHRHTNNIRPRIYKLFYDALLRGTDLPLTSLYGVLAGLSELGDEAVRLVILPHIKYIATRIDIKMRKVLFTDNDKAADRIRDLLLKTLLPVAVNFYKKFDNAEEFRKAFGCLSEDLYKAVIQAKNTSFLIGNPCNASISGCSNVQGGLIQVNSLTATQSLVRNHNMRQFSDSYRNVVIHTLPNTSGGQNVINFFTSNMSVNELLLSQKKK